MLINRQVANLRKAFAKHTSTDIKLSKTQLSKMILSGGFLSRLLGPLLKTGLPLLKSVIKSLGMLGLTVAASATDAAINKKNSWIWNNNHQMMSYHDNLKIVKSLEDS